MYHVFSVERSHSRFRGTEQSGGFCPSLLPQDVYLYVHYC